MTCIPKENGKARKISFVFMVFAVLLWMTSALEFSFRAVVQIAAIALMVVGLQILIRFGLSKFRYVLEDDDSGDTDFLIFKAQGSREAKVAHVALSKVKAILKLTDEPDFQKKYGTTANRFNYCQNMGKDAQWLLLFSDGDNLIEVRFEPDEEMVAAINNRIGTADVGGRGFAM